MDKLLGQDVINKLQRNLQHRERTAEHSTERQKHNRDLYDLIDELSTKEDK